METQHYFILDQNVRKGPYTLNDLRQLPIAENTPVWTPGAGDWQAAATIPDLAANLVLLRPRRSKAAAWIGVIAALVAVAVALWSTGMFRGTSRPAVAAATSLNNQQLYNRLSPGVVMIQQQYIYAARIGDRHYYFNELYDGEEGTVYLGGLTEDSLEAVSHAEPVQGTGFFVSADGKLLTNRHVAVPGVSAREEEGVRNAVLRDLQDRTDERRWTDSMNIQKRAYDSALVALRRDTTIDPASITDLQVKISDIETMLEENDDQVPALPADSATIATVSKGAVEVRKIVIDLRVFLPGSTVDNNGGIACTVLATADEEEVDLALLQTSTHALPDTSIRPFSLSRIHSIAGGDAQPQMSERLVLIGYNAGSDLSSTSDGIKPQLTEGKISQNTDSYKLMYTIPTLPGSSGSPVVDEKGRLVAVNYAGIASTQNFNYGIQPKQVARFLKDWKL